MHMLVCMKCILSANFMHNADCEFWVACLCSKQLSNNRCDGYFQQILCTMAGVMGMIFT